MMTTFNLPGNASVTLTLPDSGEVLKDDLPNFRPFNKNLVLQQTNPKYAFHADPYELRSIKVQAVDWFGERLGFVKFKAEIANGHGEILPGSVFLRGSSVAMMVILQPDDIPLESQDEKHVLLTIRARIPAASLALPELPAGMVDDSGTFAGAAAKEIQEELGLTIPASELTNLTELTIQPGKSNESSTEHKEELPSAIFPSPGGCDEHISIFLYEKRVPRSQLGEWMGKLTGLRESREKITLKPVRLRELWRVSARDGKCAVAGAYIAS